MIYVRRDASLLPSKVLKVAERAQLKLESIPCAERKEFIKKKSHIWRKFSRYLSMMSHGKCWYSESKDAGANYDVDHFRPKAEAKRTEVLKDEEGYAWLAFDWENFRLSAQNCNRLNTDKVTGLIVGKGSWFPLFDEGSKACWSNRCVDEEFPVLIDPVIKNDLDYIDFDDSGRFVPSSYCVGSAARRVRESADIYGLNFERMREARLLVMKDAKDSLETILQSAVDQKPMEDDASMNAIERQINKLKEKTRADALFSRAVRTQLLKLGADDFFIDRSLDAE